MMAWVDGRFVAGGGGFGKNLIDLAADHVGDDLGQRQVGSVGGDDVLPVAQNRDAVAE